VKGAKKAKGDAAPGADDFLREGELDETEGRNVLYLPEGFTEKHSVKIRWMGIVFCPPAFAES
jgi:hypothetical protein